ncbi:MAG: septal ring lytic transglycosylase RlpA family protein [Dokdonella sp.]|uniref:septal ring lytic transglycosylase RlpA family protein n=1 Tax=Dokdonella sp. TaxID=2291710 RepID=UPI0032663AEB
MTRSAVAAVALTLLLSGCASHAPTRSTPVGTLPAPAPVRGPRSVTLPPDTARPQSERYRQNADNGPNAPPIDVGKIPEPVPKNEPRSRFGNKQSYSVLGKTYSVLPNAQGYVERGIASWYGNKFHGYMTSSFETYDMYAFSAAHKTLPLPSFARVTNLDNGKSVIVRVNDRGPFHDNRIIDLSYAAAVKIGVWPKGTGLVEVRAIDPDHPDATLPTTDFTARAQPPRSSTPLPVRAPSIAEPAALSSAGGSPRIYLQLGAFGDRANAERAVVAANKVGLEHVDIQSVSVAGRTVHRVRVGPLADVEAADAMTARIEKLGLGAARVAIDR